MTDANYNITAESPQIKPKTTPRDFFGHLLSFAMLYTAVASFLTLTFQTINIRFPDALNFYYSEAMVGIRIASSILIIVWPVHIILSWLIGKDYKANPIKRDLWVRRWLVYLSLFFTSITIVADLATLVYFFYGGEITTRFVLKVLTVLIVAGSIFWYFIWDLRREQITSSKIPKATAWIVSIVILGVLIAGFVFAGSPANQRKIQFDEQRINDLQAIQNQIIVYWQKKGVLPASLGELTDNISGFSAPLDPITNQPYEYQGLSNLTFEICATFQTSNKDNSVPVRYDYYNKGMSENWLHPESRTCFLRNIDPQIYKLPDGK